ncbi:unnamed protein product [Clonostachys solani]|uniref:Uncharacterized protein n=1 Tax=Clonostachys solani TaxID=160281 RepID=A0A9N9W9G2_9HYPO|nr:unnamed protein product [Clonostachys solani]
MSTGSSTFTPPTAPTTGLTFSTPAESSTLLTSRTPTAPTTGKFDFKYTNRANDGPDFHYPRYSYNRSEFKHSNSAYNRADFHYPRRFFSRFDFKGVIIFTIFIFEWCHHRFNFQFQNNTNDGLFPASPHFKPWFVKPTAAIVAIFHGLLSFSNRKLFLVYNQHDLYTVISNISAGNAFSEFWLLFDFGFFGQNTNIYHISRIADWFYVGKLDKAWHKFEIYAKHHTIFSWNLEPNDLIVVIHLTGHSLLGDCGFIYPSY